MSSAKPTPKVNTSSLPTNLPGAGSSTAASTPLSSSTTALLTGALLSANSIPRIETALSQELAASGWTASLRAYVTNLIRSGECSTHAECMSKVMAAVRAADKGANAVGDAGLVIPLDVVREGVRTVRVEVEKVCDLRVDDVDD